MGRIQKIVNVIIQYPLRLFNGISLRAIVIESRIDKTARVQARTNIRYSQLGRYSYIGANSSVVYTSIGSFCSIASGVAIGGGSHNMLAVSTSPLFQKGRNIFKVNLASIGYSPFKETKIGNDVWIGNRAIVLQGVSIGTGSVIGAGSVVTHDIPPYEIWAGNPARKIRDRFDEDEKKQLLDIAWWDWTDQELKERALYFGEIRLFINSIDR